MLPQLLKKPRNRRILKFAIPIALGILIPTSALLAISDGVPDPIQATFPFLGNRAAIWFFAQMHILFASFILGTPIFIVISEILGVALKDGKYERLAKEMVKMVAIAYSFTALFGGGLLMALVVLYPKFTIFIATLYSPVALLYPLFFIFETLFMYVYYYSWDAMKEGFLKKTHIGIGVLLNIAGTGSMALMNSIAAFMLTPPKNFPDSTFWEIFANPTWMPLNMHRFVANITFGGYIVGIVSAFLYMSAKNKEEKAYYDWQGYIGNLIGVGAMMPIPIMGYIYANELYIYGAEIGVYMMSDRLSMFFEMQAVMVGLLFVGSNFYIYLSMKRIQGADRYMIYVKTGFIISFLCWAIWFAPRRFMATMIAEPGMISEGMELPSHLGWLALMPAKNTAAALLIIVTLVNFFFYIKSLRSGKVKWGEINPLSQYVLLFLGFTDIWLMSLMGAVRELAKKEYYVYKAIKDTSPESFTPTLEYSSLVTSIITIVFFLFLSLMIYLTLQISKDKTKKRFSS